ncbi:MAG: tRNA 2-thiouridine(34) synthase MnmA [Candidatus Muiribacterium halophilum]|uniref:tRNA-specific 2-thiouridylase MnmA n=1 Tax=Muiribacterium halophilum TaxID=2053465 RepID=A0A2N5ZHW7_MUIH1|nr:MAG: tRNA 2-thiouridine(34) synthase MnmA [Candidatus Muirbacterium halophilum]
MNNVLVGMSGGVDSSVAAMFLQKQGFKVHGVTFLLWNYDNSVCSETAVRDAQSVCKKLSIDHISKDYSDEFKDEIVNNFITEYLNARTPNPCVLCNRKIKFAKLFEIADDMGIEFVSTGHYVNIENIEGKWVIHEGSDPNKDQSYFLYVLKEEWLPRILFPLGKLTKPHVRKEAAANGLDRVKEKKDSLDICFLSGSYKDFIKDIVGEKSGDVVILPENEVIGKHSGIYNYTIGQSRGLNIAYGEKLFVSAIDSKTNTVYVQTDGRLLSDSFKVKDMNLFSILENRGDEFFVKIRHYSPKHPCRVELDKEKREAKVFLHEPVRAITPGQSAVFYDERGIVCMGGIINL